jgi:hypothetical protein
MCGILTIHDHTFNTAVFTLHEWFQQIRMRQLGWQVCYSDSSAIAEVSAVKLCFLLSEVNCFYCFWNETLSQSSYVFYALKCLYFIKNKL